MPATHRNRLLRFFRDALEILEFHDIPQELRKEIEDVRDVFRQRWSDIERQLSDEPQGGVDTVAAKERSCVVKKVLWVRPMCEVIRREGDEWVLYTKDGSRVLGRYKTKKEALERERQIQFFKRQSENDLDETGGGNVEALIRSFDDWAEGSVTKCIEVLSDKPGISQPEALCAWLKDQAMGTGWRHEKRG